MLAAGLVLAGCGSTTGGTAQVDPNGVSTSSSSSEESSRTSTSSSRSSSSQSSTSSRSSESSSEDSSSDDSTSSEDGTEDSTSDDPSGVLDAQTEAWFTTFCQATLDAGQYASPSTAGQSLEEAQLTIAQAYADIAGSAADSVVILEQTEAPTFSGADTLKQSSVGRFQTLADVYGRGSQTIAALTVTSEQDLRDAVDAVEGEATAALDAGARVQVPDDILAAAKALPACENVLG
ncbi:hypothetical protein [Nakamurella leprariae]|uniref:Uncharacterized protein n=1 Tax=Nakamurella leprariae TaxID=2803911 RepID=A0A939C1R6_9ACTN|nr:hypothetical protein [Nakamurella leprariae]MBM9467412.1 hypothetical protein [Nakamurella leprariae]